MEDQIAVSIIIFLCLAVVGITMVYLRTIQAWENGQPEEPDWAIIRKHWRCLTSGKVWSTFAITELRFVIPHQVRDGYEITQEVIKKFHSLEEAELEYGNEFEEGDSPEL